MKVFYVSWNDPETAFHEMLWKENFSVSFPLEKGVVDDVVLVFVNFDHNFVN